MIVCKLIGGLGNQMFQYAYAETLAKELNDEVCFDISFYKGKTPAIFKLQVEGKEKESPDTLVGFLSAKRAEKIYHVLQYVIRKVNHERIGNRLFRWYSKQGYYFNFDPFYYPSLKCDKVNKFIYGYFQGLQYFESVENKIRKQFVTEIGERAQKYKEQIKSCTAVAVHIRLGDYQAKKNQYMNVCTDSYYANSINYIKQKVSNPKFFIFTNDAGSVRKKEYIPEDAVIVNDTKDYEDLMLMKACRHFIISGSTFSWWGSFLSEVEGKITVAPDMWMTTLREEPAIYRDDMARIKTK